MANEGTNMLILKEKDYKIGYMLQTDSLFPWLTVLDNTLIGLDTKGENEKICITTSKFVSADIVIFFYLFLHQKKIFL